jgi:ornithine cyclodeaminase/alanine dehydrogenase-like protein (mu-crystallin family)
MTLLITDQECDSLLAMPESIAIIEEMFRLAGCRDIENPARYRMSAPRGKGLQFGPAALHTKGIMGYKIRSDFGTPIKQRWNYLYSMDTGELLAIVQANALGKLRTGAASAVAAKYLSPPDASRIGLYGAGRHARFQLEAICAVRSIRSVCVYSRTPDTRREFCRRMSEQLGIEVAPADAPEQVPANADIVVAMTSSETPVLHGDWIQRPLLVIGVGANNEFERELDEKVVAMAKFVVVDEKEAARTESGDLMWPIAHGMLRWNEVHNLGDVVAGRIVPPAFSAGVFLFKSHGVSMEDVAIATRAYELAKERGIGREIEM